MAPSPGRLGISFSRTICRGRRTAYGIWEKTDEINRSADVSPLRGFAFDPTPVQSEIAQLAAVTSEYLNRAIVADDYQAAVAEQDEKEKAAGRDTVIAEFKKQMDDWVAENGLYSKK